jgi:hypothetical protein
MIIPAPLIARLVMLSQHKYAVVNLNNEQIGRAQAKSTWRDGGGNTVLQIYAEIDGQYYAGRWRGSGQITLRPTQGTRRHPWLRPE